MAIEKKPRGWFQVSLYFFFIVFAIAKKRKKKQLNYNDGLKRISFEHESDLSSLDLSPGNGDVGQESTIKLHVYSKSELNIVLSNLIISRVARTSSFKPYGSALNRWHAFRTFYFSFISPASNTCLDLSLKTATHSHNKNPQTIDTQKRPLAKLVEFSGIIRANSNDTEKITMPPAQG